MAFMMQHGGFLTLRRWGGGNRGGEGDCCPSFMLQEGFLTLAAQVGSGVEGLASRPDVRMQQEGFVRFWGAGGGA